jgi:NAD(P)-dependent dehydrogenase (short-subunit alcohol dehydrogenase family)
MSDVPEFFMPSNTPGGERDNAIPRFYILPVQNAFKTQQEGRPIYEEREMVEILVPGDRRNTWDGMVKEEHRRRWPRQYEAFKAGLEAPAEGTAIRDWAPVNRAQAEEFAFGHVKTVEALAGLSDDQLNKVMPMGGHDLREKARRFLEQAAGAAPAEKLAAENAELRATIDQLKGQVSAFEARFAALENKDQGPPV